MIARLRPTWRIARRDALRHKGRSVLIIVMVALPVMGLSAADVIARTMQLSPSEKATRSIGQADVGLTVAGDKQPATNSSFAEGGIGHELRVGSPAYNALRSKAFTAIGARRIAEEVVGPRRFTANGRQTISEVVELSFGDSLVSGIADVRAGVAPRTARQVAVSPSLAAALGVRIGDNVALRGQSGTAGRSFTITGLIRNPTELDNDEVYATPGAGLVKARPTYLVQTARPVTWTQVRRFAHEGVAMESRYVDLHSSTGPRTIYGDTYTKDRIGVATVAIGLAILEVVLLAGAAFAVGARRQRHDLALVAAAGGGASDLAKILLAGGLVLGTIGGVLGTAAGIGVGKLALGKAADQVDRLPGHFDLRPIELLAVLILGILTGLLAAAIPARLAIRDDVVAALTGRRGVVVSNRRVSVVGLAMIVVGVIVATQAAIHFHFRIILLGASVTELGFVACAPTVVGFVGKLAGRLPLAPRLALRDASRHRGRSGPAVAAVMAAIAGSIAVSSYFVSTIHRDRAEYRPDARVGQLVIESFGQEVASSNQQAAAVVKRDLPGTRLIDVRTANCLTMAGHCKELLVMDANGAEQGLAVGGVSLLRTLAGGRNPMAEAALAAGKLVAFSPIAPEISLSGPDGAFTSLPGIYPRPIRHLGTYLDDPGPTGASFEGIISPATATKFGFGPRVGSVGGTTILGLTANGHSPSSAAIDRLNFDLPETVGANVGQPYKPGEYGVGLVALAIAAGIVTIGATAISVGLSMAESKPDLVTLSAVGGRPSTRRLLVASQAGTIAILGAAMGVVAGLIPAWAVLRADHSIPFVIPWETIVVLVVGLPILAMVGTAAFAGSRLTMDRRMG